MENKIKQLRKGILELAILGCLFENSHYGYSLVKKISGDGNITLTEGTIYPILSRLQKEDLISSWWVESSQGPPRKYYTLSKKGIETFDVLTREFKKLILLVDNVQSLSRNNKRNHNRKNKKISVNKEIKHD